MDRKCETYPITQIIAEDYGDETYYAKWSQDAFPITYDLNGAEWAEGFVPIENFSYSESTSSSVYLPTQNDMVRAGHRLLGWRVEGEEKLTTRLYTRREPEPVTVTAVWEPYVYNILYHTIGVDMATKATWPESYDPYSEPFTLPVLTRTGYTYGGWYTTKTYDVGTEITEINPANMGGNYRVYNLHLKWTPVETPVTFEPNGGSYRNGFTPPTTVTYDAIAWMSDVSSAITREHHNFLGWYEVSTPEIKNKSIPANFTEPKTFYAAWEAKTYSINYNLSGGAFKNIATVPYSYSYGKETILPEVAPRDGFRFLGWKISGQDGVVTTLSANTGGNVYLTADWAQESYGITYDYGGGVDASNRELPSTYKISDRIPLPTLRKSGYTFAGWYAKGTPDDRWVNMIGGTTGDQQYYAKWTQDDFTITYYLDSGEVWGGITSLPPSYNVNSDTITLPVPYRNGCTFGGWYTERSFLASSAITEIPKGSAGDLSLYAKWNGIANRISYEFNGGHFTTTFNLKFSYDATSPNVDLPLAADMTKKGHAFEGWYDNAEFNGTRLTQILNTSSGDKALYARWVANEYTITYNWGGATADGAAPATYNYGDSFTLPTPVWTGHSFVGWYDNADFYNAKVVGISESDMGNKTLYAKWAVSRDSVTYDLDGGAFNAGLKPISTNYLGFSAILPTENDLSRVGYKFDGWYLDAEFTGTKQTTIEAEDVGARAYYAKWSANSYDLVLDTAGGTVSGYNVPPAISFGDGAIALPSSTQITRVGHSLDGWTDSTGAFVTQITPPSGTMLYQNLDMSERTYLAVWSEAVYTITYHLGEGESIPSSAGNYGTYAYGVGMESLPTPIKAKHTFLGWYLGKGLSGEPVTSISATNMGDMELFPKWENTSYDIFYTLNGGTLPYGAITRYIYGEENTLPVPTQEGHTFLGWYLDAKFAGDPISTVETVPYPHTLSLYACWSTQSFGLQLNLNGASYLLGDLPTVYHFGVALALPTAAELSKAGHSFEGWYDNPSFDGKAINYIESGAKGDKTLYAMWKVSGYPVTYALDGGTLAKNSPTSHVFGKATTLLEPTREGYVFDGWFGNPFFDGTKTEEIPADNDRARHFYAKWSPAVYKITYNYDSGEPIAGTPATTYTYGEGYTLHPNMIREDFTFLGWYDRDGVKVEVIGATETGDRHFIAKWLGTEYKITYDPNGGTMPAEYPTSYNYGTGLALPVPTKPGYRLNSWRDADRGEGFTSILEDSKGDYSFTAQWTLEVYNITFEPNGAEFKSGYVKPIQYRFTDATETKLPTMDDMVYTGMTLEGWYTTADFQGDKQTTIPPGSYGHKVFYAKWSETNYTITFHLGDGEFKQGYTPPDTYQYGEEVDLPPDDMVSCVGADFLGWVESGKYEYANKIKVTDSGNKIFNAAWKNHSYTVTYALNGGNIAGETENTGFRFSYGEGYTDNEGYKAEVLLATNASRAHFAFDGWYDNPQFTGNAYTAVSTKGDTVGDITFYAKWRRTSYDLKLMSNYSQSTQEISEGNISIAEAYDLTPHTFSRTDYEIVGWNTAANGSGTAYTTEIGANPTVPDDGSNTLVLYAQWRFTGTVEDPQVTYTPKNGTETSGYFTAALEACIDGGSITFAAADDPIILAKTYSVPGGVTIDGGGNTFTTMLTKCDASGKLTDLSGIGSDELALSRGMFALTDMGRSSETANIKNMTLVGGLEAAIDTDFGRLTLSNVIIKQANFPVQGDGLVSAVNCHISNCAEGLMLSGVMENSTVENMHSTYTGAVIANNGAILLNSLVRDNVGAGVSVGGGALLDGTTVMNNAGVGIEITHSTTEGESVLYTVNTTVAGNAGGIKLVDSQGAVYLTNTTIAGNRATFDATGGILGHGTICAINSIIAGNYGSFENEERNLPDGIGGMNSLNLYYCAVGDESITRSGEPGMESMSAVGCVYVDGSTIFAEYDSESGLASATLYEGESADVYVVDIDANAFTKIINGTTVNFGYDKEMHIRLRCKEGEIQTPHDGNLTYGAIIRSFDEEVLEYQGGGTRNDKSPLMGAFYSGTYDPDELIYRLHVLPEGIMDIAESLSAYEVYINDMPVEDPTDIQLYLGDELRVVARPPDGYNFVGYFLMSNPAEPVSTEWEYSTTATDDLFDEYKTLNIIMRFDRFM